MFVVLSIKLSLATKTDIIVLILMLKLIKALTY